MRFLHSMIRVSDLEQSLKFYIDFLGLEEVRRSESEQGRFTLIFLATKEDLKNYPANKAPTIELTYNWPNQDGRVEDYGNARNFGHLAFAVNNIYEICETLKRNGVVINRPPRNGRMAFVKSPDNISIELLQAGEALAPQEPWASMENTGNW